MHMRFTVTSSALAAMLFAAGGSLAQNYPTKPVRILTGTPGTSVDIAARIIGQGISPSLGQPVVVDNRPGGLVAEMLAKTQPDGYTTAVAATTFWVTPLLQKTNYDMKDFTPVTMLTAAPNLIVVHPSVPVKSVKELIDYAKANSGKLNYGSGPIGGGAHLAGALFAQKAGVNIVRVAYADSGPALNGTIAGEVQMMVWSSGPMVPHIKSGRLRALAVTTAKATPLLPGIPTANDTGLPGFEVTTLVVLFAPAKAPTPVITRLNQEIVKVLNSPDVKEKFLAMGVEVVGNTPQDASTKIRDETVTWAKVIKDSGVKVE